MWSWRKPIHIFIRMHEFRRSRTILTLLNTWINNRGCNLTEELNIDNCLYGLRHFLSSTLKTSFVTFAIMFLAKPTSVSTAHGCVLYLENTWMRTGVESKATLLEHIRKTWIWEERIGHKFKEFKCQMPDITNVHKSSHNEPHENAEIT